MNRSIARLGVTGAVAAIACWSAIIADGANNKFYVGPASGASANWNSAANWSATSGGAGGAGVPASGDDVNITNSNGISRIVTYDYTVPAVSLDSLVIDLTGGSGSATNTLSLSANNLTVNVSENNVYGESVGYSGAGTFTQAGGANTINDPSNNASSYFTLGYSSGATGTYNLVGGALSCTSIEITESVGLEGTGHFNQTGGTNNTGFLTLGNGGGSNGSYGLSGTGTLSAGNEFVGENGTGTFTHSGGTNTISSQFLAIGIFAGGSGGYTLTGGTLSVSSVIDVGGDLNGGPVGQGVFNVSGGTVSVLDIYVGGTDNWSGPGAGPFGQGTLNVSGTGSITVTGTLKVHNTAGTALNLSGGTINTGSLDLDGNNSHFNWTGGTLNLTNSSVAIDDGASAWNGYSSLTLNSGMALIVSRPETVGLTGTGAVTLAGGRNSVGGGSGLYGLYIGYGSGSHGTYTISGNGSLASLGGETIGSSGTGILNQSSGQNNVFSGSLSLGVNSGSSGTYTLSGGTLSANDIYVGGSSAGPGGTGMFTVSGSSSAANITVYNTPGSGFNVNGGIVNAAALNLIGTYTQTAGSATYSHITGGGQMTVSGGQVILTDDTSGNLAKVSVSGTTTLGFDIGTNSASQIVATTATFNTAPTIAFTLSGYPEGGSVFTLLSATTLNDNGNLAGLPSQAVTIGRDTLTPSFTGGSGAAGSIIVTITGGPANLTWIGSNNIGLDTGGAWDTQSTHNWDNHSNESLTPDVLYAGDHVTFDDTAANFVVDLNSGNVIANSVTFNNSLNAYTVNGFNGIAGQGSVTFAGSNMVTLNNYNSYTGTTTISGGGLVSISGTIASPTINVTHGTLRLAVTSALSGTPVVTLGNGTTTGVLDLAGTTNTVGGLSGGAGNRVTNTNPALATLNVAGGSSTFGGVIQDGNSGGQVALNIASGSLTLSGGNTYTGGTTVNGGTLAVNGSILGDVAVNFGGTLAGHGSVGGSTTVAFGGFLAPGADPTSTGKITLGSLMLSSGSQTNIKLAGTTPGSQYDQVAITGSATLAGTLAVSLIGGFTPLSGETFEILVGSTPAGTFDTLQLPNLTGVLSWDTSQLYTSGVVSVAGSGLPGDYSNNGVVDAADYIVWRANLGTNNVLPNDPIGGTIGMAQYNQWRANFGQTAGSGSSAVASAAIPEPATTVLLILVTAGWCFRRGPVA